jgi:hypothetical protein|nr:MAG TPA: hypothetical protein [Bacteriophage sp.]
MKTKVAIVALGIATVVPWTVGEKAIFLVVIAVAYVIAEGLIRLWAIRRDAKLAREYKIEIEEQMKIKDNQKKVIETANKIHDMLINE